MCLDYSVADEAISYIISLADEYKIGVYNPQSSEVIYPKNIEILKYGQKDRDDTFTDWYTIEIQLILLIAWKEELQIERMPLANSMVWKEWKKMKMSIFNVHQIMSKGFLNNLLNLKVKYW